MVAYGWRLDPKLKTKVADPPFAWRVFDLNQDGYLQIEEIQRLVAILLSDFTCLDSGGGEHPPVRDRILNIAFAFDIKPLRD